ncbi:DUF3883 domain-containing protein [Seohaeicola saemankumensis]|uniref:DUF3883 domain-containing protein n=1 Tax=Seohaeicola saemankumensis TaxID=481181 RepID=A0ABW3T9S3_9RHOB
MRNTEWTDQENDLIVADYFEMLLEEVSGRAYNKAAHRRALLPKLENKSNGSVEFKHQNISAVLHRLGLPWLKGYKPRHNFQGSLVEAVERWIRRHAGWKEQLLWHDHAGVKTKRRRLFGLESPPEAHAKLSREAEERIKNTIRKFDFAGQDQRNRDLGLAGEQLVLEFERHSLTYAGRPDLAERVRHVSAEDGDGAGYDIASFYPDGRERLLEVKTTNGGKSTTFFISSNELATAQNNPSAWVLVRVWNFSREPRAFELRPPLEDHVQLVPTAYLASFG